MNAARVFESFLGLLFRRYLVGMSGFVCGVSCMSAECQAYDGAYRARISPPRCTYDSSGDGSFAVREL